MITDLLVLTYLLVPTYLLVLTCSYLLTYLLTGQLVHVSSNNGNLERSHSMGVTDMER